MEEEILDKYRKAGKVAFEALQYGKTLIKKGDKLLDAIEKIEKFIIDKDAGMAFPPQISLNETAAHYCPEKDDETIFEDQLCCLDIGVHVDGCIGDNALSVDLSGKNPELVKASEDALNAAIKAVQEGNFQLGQIGKAIEEAIISLGFQPVRNLSGHGLDINTIHSGTTIPNYDTKDKTELEKGKAYAIEPFATTGAGMIHEKGKPNVFAMTGKKSVRVGFVRDIQKQIEKFNRLPFTKRWIKSSDAQINFAFNQFKQLEIMKEYPPLVERSNGLVSQAEKTIYIDDEGKVEILTQ